MSDHNFTVWFHFSLFLISLENFCETEMLFWRISPQAMKCPIILYCFVSYFAFSWFLGELLRTWNIMLEKFCRNNDMSNNSFLFCFIFRCSIVFENIFRTMKRPRFFHCFIYFFVFSCLLWKLLRKWNTIFKNIFQSNDRSDNSFTVLFHVFAFPGFSGFFCENEIVFWRNIFGTKKCPMILLLLCFISDL